MTVGGTTAEYVNVRCSYVGCRTKLGFALQDLKCGSCMKSFCQLHFDLSNHACPKLDAYGIKKREEVKASLQEQQAASAARKFVSGGASGSAY